MASYEQLWIATEVTRYANMVHDGLDACRWAAKGYSPDNGLEIDRAANTEDIKKRIKSWANAARINITALEEFVAALGSQTVADALSAWGLSPSEISNRLKNFRAYADNILSNADSISATTDFDTLATYLDNNVPQWKSVRRRWAL